MNIITRVASVGALVDNYGENEFPFAIYIPKGTKRPKGVSFYLNNYYDEVIDKRGNSIYYCNIINPHKFKMWKGASINGKLLKGGSLKKYKGTGKYELWFKYSGSGEVISSRDLVKSARGIIYGRQIGEKLKFSGKR